MGGVAYAPPRAESRDDPEGAGERARADGWGAGAGERGGDEPGQKRAVEKRLSECRTRERLRKLDPGPLASTTDKVVRPQLDGGAQDTSTAATSVTVAMDRTATGRLDSNGRLRAGASPSVRLEVLKVAAASGTHAAEAIGPRTAPDALGGTAGTDARRNSSR